MKRRWPCYEAYKPYVFGILSDARFRREGRLDDDAGLRVPAPRPLRDLRPAASAAVLGGAARDQPAEDIPAVFIDKNSPFIRDEMHAFFLEYLGFGKFIFRLPDGTALDQAVNLVEFEEKLKTIPDASLLYHATRNHFSNWVMARAEVALARRLHRDALAPLE